MVHSVTVSVLASMILAAAAAGQGHRQVLVAQREDAAAAGAAFQFATVAAPSATDAASSATFQLVDGQRDGNGGDLQVLHDGKLPDAADAPAANFFLAGREGGRLMVDLGSTIAVAAVNTYSWHPDGRGPQVYRLYAADGAAVGFAAAPKRGTDPQSCGWQLLAAVDTRPRLLGPGGQHGVSVVDAGGPLGTFRYLLFELQPSDADSASSNTFYSEIDVVAALPPPPPITVRTADGKYEITVDVTAVPALHVWATRTLLPVLLDWYPKIVTLLPSEDFTAPTSVHVTFENPGRGVAATSGTNITCASEWFFANLDGEAVGAVVHELVHVVQQYGQRRGERVLPAPGWLTEGIADYVRWFLYEPDSHGADHIDPSAARLTAGYRVTANFLHWLTASHADAVPALNRALRAGTYNDQFCRQQFGSTLSELGRQWQRELLAAAANETAPNTLSVAERRAGWRLLWNGKDFVGWHSYHQKGVLPGWQIKDGVITCVDPHNAGDLCTNEQYGAFELSLEYNISSGGNSGIMFHVDNQGGTTWASGPECQLLDNKDGKDPQRAGWLYGLYSTEVDATRPAGEWNHLRLLITPELCEHEMNGVLYFKYVMNSADFAQRLAKSKFARMPKYAKSSTGFLALQGDHGLISFRNIKVRPVVAKK